MRRYLGIIGFALWLSLLPTLRATETGTIRVVFFNLENYLSMGRSVDGTYQQSAPKPESEIADVIAQIVELQPDVLGVCEIGTEEDLADLQSRLAEAGIDLPHTEYAGGDDETRHLALLSRFEIENRNSQKDLPYQLNGRIMRMQRGILDATVAVTDEMALRCLVVHFKSKRPVPEGQALMRRNEAQITRRHISTILRQNPETNLLLMGDLNDTKNEPAVQEILGERGSPYAMQDIPLADEFGDRWTHHWEVADLYSRIDFMMVSQALAPLVVAEKSQVLRNRDGLAGSDHRALLMTLRLPE